jgi:DNA-binding HxlR family transcriptional regulator
MALRAKSNCPICYSLDVFGDKWTLLLMRDMLLGGKRYYRYFLNSGEGIATNILATRLRDLVECGLVTRADDPENKGQTIYAPTEKAAALLPVLEEMEKWALQFGPKRLVPLPRLRGPSGSGPGGRNMPRCHEGR